MDSAQQPVYDPLELAARQKPESPDDSDSHFGEPFLWQFYFWCGELGPLKSLARELDSHHYNFIKLEKDDGSELEEGEEPQHALVVGRVETHSLYTLEAREESLDQIAAKHGALFDGNDVGPPTELPE